jgi:hypothetical protein
MPATEPVTYLTPDFHPEDKTPGPFEPMPVYGGRLLVPLHWGKLWGIDFGIGHSFAAVLAAWDRDSDVLYMLKTVKIKDAIPDVHVAAMKRIAGNAPVAWPHDGNNRDKGSGETLAAQYKALGLHMLEKHATFPDGGYSTEAAVHEMDQRMRTGRFRVCEDLNDWWSEYRLYHRKNGLIVKDDDDLLSATQKIVMMKRHCRPGPFGPEARRTVAARNQPTTDFDLFTGQPFA